MERFVFATLGLHQRINLKHHRRRQDDFFLSFHLSWNSLVAISHFHRNAVCRVRCIEYISSLGRCVACSLCVPWYLINDKREHTQHTYIAAHTLCPHQWWSQWTQQRVDGSRFLYFSESFSDTLVRIRKTFRRHNEVAATAVAAMTASADAYHTRRIFDFVYIHTHSFQMMEETDETKENKVYRVMASGSELQI